MNKLNTGRNHLFLFLIAAILLQPYRSFSRGTKISPAPLTQEEADRLLGIVLTSTSRPSAATPYSAKSYPLPSSSAISSASACRMTTSPVPPAVSSLVGALREIELPITRPFSPVEPECSTNFYMELISSKKFSRTAFGERLWNLIENHETNVQDNMEDVAFPIEPGFQSRVISHNSPCPVACLSSTLNAIYESFLAKKVIEFEGANAGKNIKPVFTKILDKLTSYYGPEEEARNRDNWSKDPFLTIYPVAQKELKTSEQLKLHLEAKDDIPIFLDYYIGSYGFKRPALAQSTLLPYGISLEASLKLVQNHCYSGGIAQARGTKVLLDPNSVRETRQVGIVKDVDVPGLVAHPTHRPWKHSGELAMIVPDSSDYITQARKRQIPMACGVSGTTNIALWSLFSLNIDLSPKELRTFLLANWANLCADGGHSLQEVLSATKVIANYIQEKELARYLNPTTLASLNEITRSLSVDGTDDPRKFGYYHDSFFRDIEADTPDFKTIKAEAQREFLNYFESSPCKAAP